MLYNTRTRAKEKFTAINPRQVTMYNCGPTVYNYATIGNLRSYVFADTIRRVLEWNGFNVKQVINITDVGHLVSDEDEGEDKIELGAKREGKSAEQIIELYTDAFFADLWALNILPATLYPRATAYIEEQKALIAILEQKGFVYITADSIYFDTSKFPTYADFANLDVTGLVAGARVNMGEKRNLTDFALWKFSPEDGAQREQEWPSPLGLNNKGFPGWHIECSAIIHTELGEQIDIHTGGVDHIPVHHSNEIAQSESATGKHPFVNYWMHHAHILINGEKISKSLGNGYRLQYLHERGIPPLAYRYWLLTAHYRTQVNFTWEALAGAQSAYNKLTNIVLELPEQGGVIDQRYADEFAAYINDDLNTAEAIALIWKLIKDRTCSNADKYATLLKFDEVLGLGLDKVKEVASVFVVPDHISVLVQQREQARNEKNFAESDRLREQIAELGYEVKDSPQGQKLQKLH
jgi:cysteinyl-tRNA synthetase